MNKLKYFVISLFCVLTVFFFVPLNFLISNFTELDISFTKLFITALIFNLILCIITGSYVFLPKGKKLLASVFAVLGLFTYFEMLFIVPRLGQLNGAPLHVHNFAHLTVIEGLFLVFLIFLVVKFYKKENYENVLYKTTLFFLILQAFFFIANPRLYASFSLELNDEQARDGIYSYKYYTVNSDKYNVYSKNHNIAIVLMDAFGKGIFEELLAKYPEYKSLFKDFEFYRDTLSRGAQTSFAIPALFGGEELESSKHDEVYYKNLKRLFTKEDAILNVLKRNGYNNYVYPFATNIMYLNPAFIDNLELYKKDYRDKIMGKIYLKLLRNTTAFYAMPVMFKKSPHRYLTKMTLEKTPILLPQSSYFREDDFYKGFKDKMSVDNEDKVFKFYHLRGLHEPYVMNEKFELQDMSQYGGDPVELTAKLYMAMIKNFLDRLKEEGIYDKTAIIFMSDHGSGRFISPLQSKRELAYNSLLLYKGINQRQDEMKIVDGIYPDIEDISDLVLYSAGLSKEKFTIKNEAKNKELLISQRLVNKNDLDTYYFKKFDLDIKADTKYDAGLYYFSVAQKRGSVTFITKTQFKINTAYYIFEGENGSYAIIMNLNGTKIIPIFNTDDCFFGFSFIGDNLPEGEYRFRTLFNDGDKYFEFITPIEKVIVTDQFKFVFKEGTGE